MERKKNIFKELKSEQRNIRKLLLLLRPCKKNIIILLILMILSSGLSTITPLLSKQLMDNGLIPKNMRVIFIITILSFGIIIVNRGLDFIRDIFQFKVSSIFSFSLTKMVFKHSLKLNLQYFNKTNLIELMNNISYDIYTISQLADKSMFFIVLQVFEFIGGIIGISLFVDYRLALISFAELPIKFFVINYLSKKRKKSVQSYMDSMADYSNWYGDTVGGIREVKLLGIDRIKIGEFIKKQRKIIKSQFNMSILDTSKFFFDTVLTQVVTSIVYLIGGLLIIKNELTVGELFAFFTYSLYLSGPISSVLQIGYMIADIIPSSNRFFEFLDMKTDENKITKKRHTIYPNNGLGNIQFDKVSFSYQAGEDIFKDISFEIKKGEKVAIVGKNGCGKSTLMDLILRLNCPNKGKIYLNSVDIENYKLKDYRKLFSVVSQNTYLFNTTIRENILGLKIDNEKLYKVSKDSGAHDFIEKLQNKYDTIVGTNGSNLSGGERQKIAIARALASDSPFLILDEANASSDISSEIEFTKILKHNYMDKTIIVITHRANILELVDRVIVMRNGSIESIGTHSELKQCNALNYEMLNTDIV